MAKLLTTAGETKEVQPASSKRGFTLKELYSLIGCDLVEVVGPNKKGEIMICDEEGKINGSERNQLATDWYWENYGPWDIIMGNAVICKNSEFK